MADLNRKMAEGHTVSDLDTVIDEVYGAHGDYDTLGDRLDDIDTIIDTAKLGIHYKGEVNYYSNLPTTGVSIGDAYTVKYSGTSGTTPDGTEYVWGTVSGTNQWINFSKDSYTKAEVDALLALKVDTAGTGLSKSGTTLNHSNSTTAKTTQGFAQIAYDAQGHITGSTAATTAQANAINSGIDSTKVEQIETNKNNILSLTANGGGLNILDIQNPVTHVKTSYTPLSNGGVELSCSAPNSAWTNYNIADIPCITGKTYKVYIYIDEVSANPVAFRIYLRQDDSTGTNYIDQRITKTGSISYTITAATNKFWVGIYLNNSDTARTVTTKMRMMIVQSDTDVPYQPYAMSNAELTAKEQANENNILYNTNAGFLRKNFYDLVGAVYTGNGTYTKGDDSITVYTTGGAWKKIESVLNAPSGDYKLKFKISNYSSSSGAIQINIYTNDTAETLISRSIITGNGEYTADVAIPAQGAKIAFGINYSSDTTASNSITVSECMLYSASISDTTYQPYAMSNVELTAKEQANENNILSKQDALTTAQLAAVNSGIDSTKVAQIETNKNNISSAYGGIVGKNKIYPHDIIDTFDNDVSYIINPDNTITYSGAATNNRTAYFLFTVPETGEYMLTGCPSGGGGSSYYQQIRETPNTSTSMNDSGSGKLVTLTANTTYYLFTLIVSGTDMTAKTFSPMICKKTDYDVSPIYQPYVYDNLTISNYIRQLLNS